MASGVTKMSVPVTSHAVTLVQAIRESVTPAGTVMSFDELTTPELSISTKRAPAPAWLPSATQPDFAGQLTEKMPRAGATVDTCPGTPPRTATTSPILRSL